MSIEIAICFFFIFCWYGELQSIFITHRFCISEFASSLKFFSNSRHQHLWWFCSICRCAQRSKAVESPSVHGSLGAAVCGVAQSRTRPKRLSSSSSSSVHAEGNGTPLQYSCLENPMGSGAWWAAVHGVAKSQTRLSEFTFMHWRRKWQPTPVFLPGESQGRGSLVGCCLWGRTELDTTEAT